MLSTAPEDLGQSSGGECEEASPQLLIALAIIFKSVELRTESQCSGVHVSLALCSYPRAPLGVALVQDATCSAVHSRLANLSPLGVLCLLATSFFLVPSFFLIS